MPPTIGFPAQPRHGLMARLIADLRARSDRAREEAVTGRHADPARALGGRLTELYDLERSLALNAQHRQIAGLAQARAAVMQEALGVLGTLASDLAADTQTALDAHVPAGRAALSDAAGQALTAAVSALNVSQAGRGLFAGDAGPGPALADAATIRAAATAVLEAAPPGSAGYADLATAFSDPAGVFATTLYRGGANDAPASEIAEGERLAFAPRADDPVCAALLRDLAALAAAFDPEAGIADDQREAVARAALAGLRAAVSPLTSLAAELGTAEQRIADVQARHQASEAALTQAFNALAGRDQFEAAAELSALEAQLETSFLTTARLSSLSLANFLR